MNFDLFTIWAREAGAPEAPWCVDAWDEFSIDENYDGWVEALDKAKGSNEEVRVVKIRIRHEDVIAAFDVASVEGEVIK